VGLRFNTFGRWWLETHRLPGKAEKRFPLGEPATWYWLPPPKRPSEVVFYPPGKGVMVGDVRRHVDWWEGVEHRWDPRG
jgi:hypothetical protein